MTSSGLPHSWLAFSHDDVIKWKHFPRYWPFVRGIHRSPVNSPHKGQWRGALMFSFICAWINGWVDNRDAGDWRRHRSHYDVSVIRWKYKSHLSIPSQITSSADHLHFSWTIAWTSRWTNSSVTVRCHDAAVQPLCDITIARPVAVRMP